MKCTYKKYRLDFIKPGGTSRGVLKTKDTYFLVLQGEQNGKQITALGECNRFANLSYDDRAGYEEKLKEVCLHLPRRGKALLDGLLEWPSIYFGVEMLLRDWNNGGNRKIFPEVATEHGFSVPINGLIWMGAWSDMRQQIDEKLQEFNSIKLKIGALNFERELELIDYLRSQKPAEQLEIRLDANGAYTYEQALENLKRLEPYDINYLEQPIAKGRWDEMARLVEETSIKIALDEELIGVIHEDERQKLIDHIRPDLLVLKPALIGGFQGADDWKKRIRAMNGDWVITSALESNIGLNAIVQYAAMKPSSYAQGLGTGLLYANNIPSPYVVEDGQIHYKAAGSWDLTPLI